MIGNDVVDLQLSQIESNWQRKGFLDKIFTKNEQFLIQQSENQEIAVWNLWSRKEAAYKILNRETGIRKYNPIQFECCNLYSEIGKVQFESTTYYTKTEISSDFIYSIAVSNREDFCKIETLNNSIKIKKTNGIPYYINDYQKVIPISKSNHGRFERIVSIKSPI
jgi:phosphopantetheinyl transferase (holo-ACP synthase)